MPFLFAKRFVTKAKSFKKAFTLIELLVVITIFGLITVAITTSYISFEQNQRLNNAAKMLKTDIRYAQNQALAGDKSTPNCPVAGGNITSSQLWGWYINISNLINYNLSYTISSICNIVATSPITQANYGNTDNWTKGPCTQFTVSAPYAYECRYLVKTVNLPSNVSFGKINNAISKAYVIVFQPVQNNVSFYNWLLIAPPATTAFTTYSGGSFIASSAIVASSSLSPDPTHCSASTLEIDLKLSTNTNSLYYVCVSATGGVNETHN